MLFMLQEFFPPPETQRIVKMEACCLLGSQGHPRLWGTQAGGTQTRVTQAGMPRLRDKDLIQVLVLETLLIFIYWTAKILNYLRSSFSKLPKLVVWTKASLVSLYRRF